MYTTYWSNWHHGTNTYYWKYNLLIKPHIKDYSDWNDNCVVSKTKFLSFFFGLGVFMMIGIWKYKPQEKSKNIDKAWSSIFLAKIALFCTWSVLFGWVHVAPNPYHDPVNITHIPNFLTPFFFLWLAHRHCTIFHSPLFQKSTVTLHYITKYMDSWPSMHASSASDSAINDFGYIYIYIWTKLITVLKDLILMNILFHSYTNKYKIDHII